jgi:histone H3/H4
MSTAPTLPHARLTPEILKRIKDSFSIRNTTLSRISSSSSCEKNIPSQHQERQQQQQQSNHGIVYEKPSLTNLLSTPSDVNRKLLSSAQEPQINPLPTFSKTDITSEDTEHGHAAPSTSSSSSSSSSSFSMFSSSDKDRTTILGAHGPQITPSPGPASGGSQETRLTNIDLNHVSASSEADRRPMHTAHGQQVNTFKKKTKLVKRLNLESIADIRIERLARSSFIDPSHFGSMSGDLVKHIRSEISDFVTKIFKRVIEDKQLHMSRSKEIIIRLEDVHPYCNYVIQNCLSKREHQFCSHIQLKTSSGSSLASSSSSLSHTSHSSDQGMLIWHHECDNEEEDSDTEDSDEDDDDDDDDDKSDCKKDFNKDVSNVQKETVQDYQKSEEMTKFIIKKRKMTKYGGYARLSKKGNKSIKYDGLTNKDTTRRPLIIPAKSFERLVRYIVVNILKTHPSGDFSSLFLRIQNNVSHLVQIAVETHICHLIQKCDKIRENTKQRKITVKDLQLLLSIQIPYLY